MLRQKLKPLLLPPLKSATKHKEKHMPHLNKTQKSLLTVHMLRMVLELFTSTFLTSHIVSLTPDNMLGDGLFNIGLFYISEFFIYAVFYLLVSYFVDKSNRVNFLRFGIFVYVCLLVALVFWGEQISSWIILAGALVGFSDAFYYSSYLVMKTELTNRGNIKNFNIHTTIITNVIKIVVPTILGFLIDISSYSNIAIYIIIISLVQFAISFMVKSHRPKNSKFELKPYFYFLKENKEVRNKIKYTYFNAALVGPKSTYKIIVVILTIYTFKTNLSLGLFTSIFSIVTMLLLMIFKKLDGKQNLKQTPIYLLIGILPVIACLIMVLWLNKITLIIYNAFLTIAIYFSEYFGSTERDAIIKNVGKYEFIAEHQFIVETVQDISRIIAYGLFVVIGSLSSIFAFKVLLMILILANPVKYLVMNKQRKIRMEFEQQNLSQTEIAN